MEHQQTINGSREMADIDSICIFIEIMSYTRTLGRQRGGMVRKPTVGKERPTTRILKGFKVVRVQMLLQL